MQNTMLEHHENVRPWHRVSAGLRVQRAGLRVALFLAAICGASLTVVDHSDRGLQVVIFLGSQGVLAIVQVAGLGLISIGPDSQTRRQACRTGWFVVAAAILIGAMAVLALVAFRFPHVASPESLRLQLLALAFALFVDLALVGYLWFGVHAALGYDLDDGELIGKATALANAWAGACLVGGLFLAWTLVRAPSVDFTLFVPAAVAIVVFEGFHLALVKSSQQTLARCERFRQEATA